MRTIALSIDGQAVTVAHGASVLDAARKLNIEVPAICSHPDLTAYGACRMCVVEIEGVRGFPTACTTPAAEGMQVKTQSESLSELRENTLDLMLSGHPNACLVCDYRTLCEKHKPNPSKAGTSTRCGLCGNRSDCGIREMVLSHNGRASSLPTLYSHKRVERDDPFIERDHNLCILCGLCWRICEKIHGSPAISIVKRGKEARIAASFDRSWVDSDCTFCGACVDICPTGTITDRFAKWHGHPDGHIRTTCTLCSEGCEMYEMMEGNTVVATRMTAFTRDARLCSIGRFAYPQLLQHRDRIARPLVKINGDLIPVSEEEALAYLTEQLEPYRDGSFLLIGNECDLRETKELCERFAVQHMRGSCYFQAAGNGSGELPKGYLEGINSGRIRAVLTSGNHLPDDCQPQCLVVMDAFSSTLSERADAVLPVAILAEVTGTFRDVVGQVKTVGPAIPAPGFAKPEWHWLRDLAVNMGASDFSAFEYVPQVSRTIVDDPAPTAVTTRPRDDLKGGLIARYRGHLLAARVPSLKAFGLPNGSTHEDDKAVAQSSFVIEKKEEIAPNFHSFVVRSVDIARHAKAGQFIMVMTSETSERVPFTLTDWDAEAGTIQFIVEETGRSSAELCALKAGDAIAHISGPLGTPLKLDDCDTVALAGGCYGIGAIYPFAKHLHALGKRVYVVLEASSHFLFFLESELRAVCDEIYFTSRDGSKGRKGAVHDVLLELLESEDKKPDAMVAIGCTLMMQMAADATRDWQSVPLHVALNPIMIDGTGMCGACRVSVGNETLFACVDGPFFNGHQVDWQGLASRRAAYLSTEIEAMPQEGLAALHAHHHHHG
jgi:NAD(P)H-flavin reductase/ferredoxin